MRLAGWLAVPLAFVATADFHGAAQDPAPAWAQWPVDSLFTAREATGRPYLPFLRVPTMRAGVYVLDVAATDGQRPHREDELYYVVAGRGRITVGGVTQDVAAGSLLFVKANEDHRFHDIAERLEIVVFFSTAESR